MATIGARTSTMKYAGNVVPSPDGKWVAFTDLHNAYIAPFPRTGDTVELSKDTRAFPVRQVTKDAGFDLHWSADSERLHWVYGPEYFTRELRHTFAFVDGAPDELPEPEATGTPIRLVCRYTPTDWRRRLHQCPHHHDAGR
jgi:hypothetical protein